MRIKIYSLRCAKPAILILSFIFITFYSVAGVASSLRDEIKQAAKLYVFGYPLVIMDITKNSFLRRGGVENKFLHVEEFPTPEFRDVVRPNVDTLYSLAWLNLLEDGVVLTLPENSKRYYLLTILDGWTNVPFSLGTRQGSPDGASYLLVGPNWDGEVPAGLELLQLPTNMSWIIARVQANGEKDIPIATEQQKSMSLVTLTDWLDGVPETVIDYKGIDHFGSQLEEPLYQLNNMPPKEFVSRLTSVMEVNPAPERDFELVNQLNTKIGAPATWSYLDDWVMNAGFWIAKHKFRLASREVFSRTGWATPPRELGDYGDDYALRAFIAMIGLGANRPEDAMYPTVRTDQYGEKLNSSEDYVIHFEQGQLPPVKAFWSITLYDKDGFLVENDEDRYAIGDRDGLYFNDDGSLDLYIQSQKPSGEYERNWLPSGDVPAFTLTARLYWPSEAALSGEWTLPPVKRRE